VRPERLLKTFGRRGLLASTWAWSAVMPIYAKKSGGSTTMPQRGQPPVQPLGPVLAYFGGWEERQTLSPRSGRLLPAAPLRRLLPVRGQARPPPELLAL